MLGTTLDEQKQKQKHVRHHLSVRFRTERLCSPPLSLPDRIREVRQ